MHLTALLLVVYGLVVLAGGVFGYAKAKSLPSLLSGVVSAAVVIIAALLYSHHPRLSVVLGALVGLTLAIVMSIRYSATKKPIPALPVALLSVFLAGYSIVRLVHLLHQHAR